MNQAILIIESKGVIEKLTMIATQRIKSDGSNCSHLMHEIGMPDEEGYTNRLKIASSETAVLPMPTDMQDPLFKEKCYLARLSIQVVADLRKLEEELFNVLAEKIGSSHVSLSSKSEWAKQNGKHTFIELLAYYQNHILVLNPTNIECIREMILKYNSLMTFEENAANLMVGISALQPNDAVTQYQKLELLKGMIQGQPSILTAYNHYCQANPKFIKRSIESAIKYIDREISSNPTDKFESSVNNVLHEEMMEINTQLIQNQAAQEAMINHLTAKVNAMSSMPTPSKATTKYCHLHGPNNSHNGTECKKMGSPGFTISGKAITQAMINNRVPGKVVDGVTGKK